MKNRNSKLIIYLFLILPGLVLSPLFSDDFFQLKEEIIRGSWRKIGFIYFTPSLLLQEVGYTSNIYSYDQDVNPDWTADLGVETKFATVVANRFIFRVTETPYYSYYRENVKERSFNNKIKGELFTHIGNFNIGYNYFSGRYKARPTSEFGARTEIRKLEHGFKFELGNPGSINLSSWLGYDKISFNENEYLDEYNLSRSLDKTEKRAGIALLFPIFTKTYFSINAEYFEYQFRDEEIRDGNGEKIFLEVRFPKISIIRGSFSIGVKHFKPFKKVAEEYVKPFGSGHVTIKLFSKMKFFFSYSIDNHYSFWQPDAYYDNRNISVGINVYPLRKIRVGYIYGFENSRYRKISGEYLGREDNILTSEVSIVLKAGEKDGIGLKYTYFRSNSSLLDFDMNYSFIGGFITHEF